MSRRKNVINGLVFFAPVGIVLSAIPQAPDYTAPLGWALALVMLGVALVLALRGARGQRDDEATRSTGAPGDAPPQPDAAAPAAAPAVTSEAAPDTTSADVSSSPDKAS